MHTNLVLGANWAPGEWPDYVEVTHDGEAGGRRYVIHDGEAHGRRYAPERTCRNASDPDLWDFKCSKCGIWYEEPVPMFRYCPGCGARVVKEEQ